MHSYLPGVFSRLIRNCKCHEIAAYLIKVEEGSMGMTPNKEIALQIARILIEAKEWIVGEAFLPIVRAETGKFTALRGVCIVCAVRLNTKVSRENPS